MADVIPGTYVQLTPPDVPTHRGWLRQRAFDVACVVVYVLTMLIYGCELIGRVVSAMLCHAPTMLLKLVAWLARDLVANVTGARTPRGAPYSLVNAAQPDWTLPQQVDEVAATITFARLAYEDHEQRRSIVNALNRPHQPQLAVLSDDVLTVPGSSHHRYLHAFGVTLSPDIATSDTQVFFGQFGTSIVVAFRGTEPLNLTDWSTDFFLGLEDTKGLGKMHRGFKEALGVSARQGGVRNARSLYHAINREVERYRAAIGAENPVLLVTGHSLGAALAATFSALYMRDHPDSAVHVYPYAQPRVGNKVFCQELERLVASTPNRRYRRFVNCNDIVNRVPASLATYAYEPDVIYANGMETYYIDPSYNISRLPRGDWSEYPPLHFFSFLTKLRTRQGHDTAIRHLMRFADCAFIFPNLVNDHFPMDYKDAIVANTRRPPTVQPARPGSEE